MSVKPNYQSLKKPVDLIAPTPKILTKMNERGEGAGGGGGSPMPSGHAKSYQATLPGSYEYNKHSERTIVNIIKSAEFARM